MNVRTLTLGQKTSKMAYQYLLTEKENGVLTITINRPEALNALNTATIAEIRDVVENIYADSDISAAILTGAGDKSFVAGADIKEISTLNEVMARKFAENGQEVFQLIADCEKPIIAAVNGFALGGGCELAMACHMRFASTNAKFGQPEVNLGLIPGYGGTQRLTELIGRGRALEFMLTGDMINAEEASQLGLVNLVLESKEALLEHVSKVIAKIQGKAPLAVGMVINAVNAFYNKEENGYQTEANGFSTCTKTEDFQEGVNAFIEKRKPEFKGT